MKRCFIDSNVVIYANDGNARRKQDVAVELIKRLMAAQTGCVSVQVLQEYANTALSKLNQETSVVLRQLKLLERLVVVAPDAAMVRRAVEIRSSYQIAFWDASIVAAAESVDCDVILSEDLNAGQYYASTRVVNPFAAGFPAADFVS